MVSGRTAGLPGAERIVGLLANTLPVRTVVAPERPLIPWLQDLQTANAEMLRHEATPLAEIRSWSGLPGETPLFESLLSFENYPVDPALATWGGLALSDVETFQRTHYPLELVVMPGPATLTFAVLFDRDRLDEAGAARLAEDLKTLLAGFADVDIPERRLGEMPLLERTTP
jgi:non-ribosomal peptide synthetase component F